MSVRQEDAALLDLLHGERRADLVVDHVEPDDQVERRVDRQLTDVALLEGDVGQAGRTCFGAAR